MMKGERREKRRVFMDEAFSSRSVGTVSSWFRVSRTRRGLTRSGAMGSGSRSRRREEALRAGEPDPGASADDVDDPALVAHRAHKARQRRRKTERRHAAVEAILARLTVPPADASGAFAPVEETAAWRGGEPPPVDWTSMPPSCDPAALTHDGREAAVASGNAREDPVGGAPATTRSGKTETRELSTRARRKRWQVESFATVLRELLEKRREETSSTEPTERTERTERTRSGFPQQPHGPYPPTTVVDFGAGSGALALPLAARFPEARFVAVEMKQRSADLLSLRARRAGLRNVETRVQMIETFREPFDVGIALHACGNATDHAMLRCVERGASFAVSPCCVGKLKFSLAGGNSFGEMNRDWTTKGAYRSAEEEETRGESLCVSITHPRSRWLFDQLGSTSSGGGAAEPFAALAAAADTGHGDGAGADRITALGREAKKHVELDRAQAAREAGYEVVTLSLVRGDDAPPNKNHVLVGAPRGDKAAWLRNLTERETDETSS